MNNCASAGNTGDGINISEGSQGSAVSACAAYFNTGDGIEIQNRCLVPRCTTTENRGEGIKVTGDESLIVGNQASENSNGSITLPAGADRNRIEGNHTNNNVVGISVGGADNLIINNSASNNSVLAFGITAGNIVGSILLNTATTTQPFANFEF